MNETPITVLAKQIEFYRSFIKKMENRDGIDPDASQEKLDSLIGQCKVKIEEFQIAIGKLSH